MRTIKFRAWSNEKKGWKGLWIFRGGHVGEYDVSNEKIDIFDLTEQWGKVELEQFTGLQDKNGKDIYEGDIIKHKDSRENNDIGISEMKFSWVGAYIDVDNIKIRIDMLSWVEIIGNIHENPELLNEIKS